MKAIRQSIELNPALYLLPDPYQLGKAIKIINWGLSFRLIEQKLPMNVSHRQNPVEQWVQSEDVSYCYRKKKLEIHDGNSKSEAQF